MPSAKTDVFVAGGDAKSAAIAQGVRGRDFVEIRGALFLISPKLFGFGVLPLVPWGWPGIARRGAFE